MKLLKTRSRRKESVHVVHDPEGGWNVKKGGDTAIKHFDLKQDAIIWGRALSKRLNAEFYIHGKDGAIQHKDSHGNDPFPPRDER